MIHDPMTAVFIALVVLNVVLSLWKGHEVRLHWKRPWIR